jgi:hypothetical protein
VARKLEEIAICRGIGDIQLPDWQTGLPNQRPPRRLYFQIPLEGGTNMQLETRIMITMPSKIVP